MARSWSKGSLWHLALKRYMFNYFLLLFENFNVKVTEQCDDSEKNDCMYEVTCSCF